MDRATEIKERVAEIVRESGDDKFFTTKELKALPEILGANERLIAFSSGMVKNSTWIIVLTDQRVLLLDKGMFWGMKQTSIDLRKINSISDQRGMLFAKIVISDGAAGHQIDMVAKKSAAWFVSKANEAIANLGNGGASVGNDRVAQLERLATMRDSGVLDEAEFAAEKARLLRS